MLLFLLGSLNVWGEEITYTFNSKSWGATSGGSAANWTSNKDGLQFNASNNPIGLQINVANSGANGTSPESFDNISKVDVVYNSTSKGVGSISVKIGTNDALPAQSIAKSKTNTTLSFSPETAQTGNVTITGECSTNSFAIVSVTITYTPSGGGTPEPACSFNPTVTFETASPDAIIAGETYTNIASVAYNSSATGQTITYSSSNTAVATVDASTGEVTAVKAGTVTITATAAENGDYCEAEKSYELTINAAPDSKTTKTIDLTAASYDASPTTELISWTGTYVTMQNDRNGNGNTAVNNYIPTSYNSTRFYKNNILTFTPEEGYKIDNIVFTAASENYATILANSSWENATAVASTTTVTVTASGSGAVSATMGNTCGFTQVVINYHQVASNVVTVETPANSSGTLIVTGADNLSTVAEGTELTITATPSTENHYIGGTIAVKKTSDDSDVPNTVWDGTTLTMPTYAITVSATFTPTYAINKVAEGGSIALSYTQGDAEEGYATAGTSVTATATADGSHVFTSISLSNNVENPSISENVATFTMPASAVTVTAEFAVKQDPSIVVTDGTNPITELDFGSVAKGSTPVAQTFKLSGLNLAQGTLMIASSNDTKFTVSPTSINVDGTLEETTVTVTPVTSVAGPFNDEFIMISGGGLAQADEVMIGLSLTVQETYTAKWYVNGAVQTASTVTVVAGTELTFPDAPTPAGDCAGTEFMGWLTAPLAEASADEPEGLIKTYTGHTMPAADVNYYAVFAEETPGEEVEDTYSHTIKETTWSAGGAQTLTNVSWTLTNNGNNYGYDATKGQQIGSSNNPASSMSLSTSGINGKITSVKIYTSGAKDVEATVAASVNGVAYKNDNSTSPVAISSTNTGYEFTGSETGEIVISWAQTSSKALYFKQIEVRYAAPGASTYSNYVTTCVACSNVSLVEAGETNGTITLKQGSKAVSSVKTCNGAVTLTTNAVAETGYELTNIALNGVANATVNQEMTEITIPANATGELTVTATFAQKNYEVALAQSPAAGATLDGATTTAHYNATINISTTVPDGYMFAGWTPANLFANTEAANAISTSFTMPNDDVTVTANFTQIYTVADALALVPEAGDNSDYVYVGGLISYVDETSWDENFKNINYYISANGTRENELLVFHGYKGYDKETFDAITDIKAGDKVIVYGKLTNYQGTKEFAQNNKSGVYSYIYQFTEAILSSVEVGGTLTKTDYFINDDFTREGLTAAAVYSNTGYSKDITDEATWTNNLAGGKVTEDGTVRVTATYNTVSGYKDVEVTVTTKVLESIELSETALTGYLGQAVQKPATVTAHFDDNGVKTTENVTAFASFDDSDYDASSTAEQTITVSYQFGNAPAQTADYTITLSSIRNTIETAYTVEKGRSIIDLDNLAENNLELDDEGNKVFVQGYITNITSNKYTIKDNIEDTEFIEISEGTLGDGISSVKVGDLIKVEGNLYFYENNSHTVQKHQILNGEIVAVVRTPNLTVADVAEMEVNFTADLAEADLTIDRDGSEGAITFSCSDAAVTIVNNKLHAAEAGDATVTATIAANGIYTEASTTFNVHVIAKRTRYAVTFNAGEGTGADPVIANQLPGATVDLPAVCPYSKANSAFAGWVVTETVSGNAVTVTDGNFTMPAADVTITATWNTVETCAISFMVNGVEVATANAPQTAPYTLSQEGPVVEGFTFLGWSETEYADETTTLPTMIESYTPETGEATKELYGIYSQVDETGGNLHYVLDYNADVADKSIAYNSEVNITATDGSEWIVSASKQTGMQINTGKGAYIKVPDCPANIIQIVLTCNSGAQKAVAFSESSDGAAIVTSPNDGTSQTLDFSEVNVSAGYIIPSAGNCQITHIDVEYSGSVTYYTSSPVTRYKVTYLKGEASNVTGICAAERLAAGEITLCAAPTCADKDFAKWSDGTNLYEAGAAYTLSADVTFTATWTPKPTYTVTYIANGGVGTSPDAEEYMRDATITVKSNTFFTNPGYTFDGWIISYNDGENDQVITPEEGKFTMPAYNVVIKATWAEESKQKWALVTETSQLVAGNKYIIAAAASNVAMAGQNENNRAETAVVKKNEGAVLMGTSSMQIFTLGGTTNAWEFNTGAGYIYAASSSNNHLKTQAENDANGQWTITISEGVASITANGTNTRKHLKYNGGSNIFSCYASGQSAVALYVEIPLTEINTDADESAVPDNGDVVIGEDKTWTVSVDKEVGDLYMNEGAIINNSAEVTAQDLYFSSKAGKSNQIVDAAQLNVDGDFYFDYQLCDGDLDPDYWYSVAVPFDVNVNEGVMLKNGTQLVYRSDFEVWEYDTEKRAQTMLNGWKRLTGNKMQAGYAYLIGFNPGTPNTIRFKAAEGWKDNLFSGTTISVTSAEATDGTHSNWNGLANPTMRYIDVSTLTQVFNNNTHGWDSYDPAALQFNFVVGTAFFVQTTTAVTIGNIDHSGTYRAPKREDASMCAYAVRITHNEATNFESQIIVRASEDATGEYTQGHDMLTMNNATSNTAAMLWTENYGGKRLSIEEAAWTNGTASYVLKVYAPANGTYNISVAEPKNNADLYLTKDGNIIWNLSMGEYTVDLNKGNNEGYGLMLVSKAPMVTTGVDNINASESGAQKVIINEHVYILRGEKMYDATGKMVK